MRRWVGAAALDWEARAQVGDSVDLVHQLHGEGHRLGVMKAVVEAVDGRGWPPLLRLRVARDGAVIAGDSGGGIWQNGVLQANLWATVMARKLYSTGATSEGPTDLCVAAVRPPDLRSLVVPAERPAMEGGSRLYLARLRQ